MNDSVEHVVFVHGCLKWDKQEIFIPRFEVLRQFSPKYTFFKGPKKLTVSWHTPNRVNKVTISTYIQFFYASGLPEKYFVTPSHPNTMRYPILDEE